ncbi:hypothetical protein GJ496_010849 [Pomphorhynchus laevis]|nr:hypothetical protein GJ496_010849 [Pomphorhynchus laevis]
MSLCIDRLRHSHLVRKSGKLDRARLPETACPKAASWLQVIPITALALDLTLPQFCVLTHLWLGLPIFPASHRCGRCKVDADSTLDDVFKLDFLNGTYIPNPTTLRSKRQSHLIYDNQSRNQHNHMDISQDVSKLVDTTSKACLLVKFEDLTGSNNNFVGVDDPSYRQSNVDTSPAEDPHVQVAPMQAIT